MKSDYNQKTDEELAILSVNDQQAFAVLIQRYEGKLLAYIHKLTTVSREEAEDILQESFIKVYYNLNGFDPSLKFSSWVYRITHNQVISAHRKKKVRPQGNSWSIDDELIKVLASNLDTKKEADLNLLKENMRQVFDAMSEKYRDVLILKFLEEKDYKEISDILQKPMGTIATLINRAKKQFKKEADKQGLEL